MNALKKILIVDDMEINRLILKNLFIGEFQILEAENGRAALDCINRYRSDIAVVLLDLVMPVMTGFDVLREMNQSGIIKTIPVIVITSEADEAKSIEGYTLGVSDLVKKPFNPRIIHRRVHNVADLYTYKYNLEQKLAEQRRALEQQAERLRHSSQFVIDALSTTVEFRSMESGEHIKRVRQLTRVLMTNLMADYHISPEDVEAIAIASAMHDIGKIAIPDAILEKPGRLTPEEFEIMKTHTTRGCEILESLNYAQNPLYYGFCYDICRHHHERWDGNGYPDGLKGEAIPIWAQATSIADVYDALTSKRVYKDAYSHEQALDMILDGQCGVFNPKLIDALLRAADQLAEQAATREQAPYLLNV